MLSTIWDLIGSFQKPKFTAVGLTALVINAETVETGRHAGQDLWKIARSDVAVILVAPEQLKTAGFESLIRDKTFAARLMAFSVDEAHLIYMWGTQFRPAFKQIGDVRMRLTGQPVLIALSATMRVGSPTRFVCGALGLRSGNFHLIRRSKARYDIQVLFREMESAVKGWGFPEPDWVLTEGRRFIIFCTTISYGLRITLYLWELAKDLPDRRRRVRMYNSLNSPQYNSDTLHYMHTDPRSRVTIASDALAQGIDVPNTDDVVVCGGKDPRVADMLRQQAGRIPDGRGRGS